LDLLSGKASVEQISRRMGVKPETVEKWRQVAQEGVLASLKLGGTETSARERELEKELKSLEKAFTRLAIRNEVAERELKKRGPTPLGRSLW
jgi:transposase-like protein